MPSLLLYEGEPAPSAKKLLPQPGGFEGVIRFLELGEAGDPAVFDRDHVSHSGHRFCSTPPAGTSNAYDGNYLLSRVGELLGFGPISLEYLHQVPKELLLPRTSPVVGTRLVKEDVGGVPLDIRVEDLENGLEIPTIEGRIGSPHDFDLLLRHRLLRQPGGLEGMRALRKYLGSGKLAPAKRHHDPPTALHYGLASAWAPTLED